MLNPTLIVSLDGTPFSLIQQRAALPGSIWPELLERGRMVEIVSSRPEVSSVAWASFQTGADPGEHGLFGFVDRQFTPRPRLIYPNRSHLHLPTLPEAVDAAGGTVISINVPATEPPPPVRGVVIGGFLGVSLEGNVHPPHLEESLRREGYIVDVDPALAWTDRGAMMNALFAALEARVRVALRMASEQPWDLFHLHIMETDRLFHFFWDLPEWADQFNELLRRCEQAVSAFARVAAERGARLVLLSDHGFTRARRVVFINAILHMAGLLAFESGTAPSFETIHRSSLAYALPPGRIFLSLRGREPWGTIVASEYDRVRDRIIGLLREVKDPLDGLPVFTDVLPREDVYRGPFVNRAADILAFARDGYDLKADFEADRVFHVPNVLVGTHTWSNAFFFASDSANLAMPRDITGAGRTVRELLGIGQAG